MTIKNKLEKVLISFSGILLAAVFVFGIKMKTDSIEKENLKKRIDDSLSDNKNLTIQDVIESSRKETISKIISAPGRKLVEDVITTTEIPKIIVEEKKSDKKTKSS